MENGRATEAGSPIFVSGLTDGRTISVQVHRHQELRVARHLFQPPLEQLDRFDRVHVAEHAAETIDQLQLLRIEQQLFGRVPEELMSIDG